MSEFPTDKTAASKKQSLEERMESKADEADSLMDMSQALLQLLGNAMPAGNTLLSPLLLAQAASGSLVPAAAAAAQMSLPWVLPAQYQQLMVLQQGLAQQLLVPGVGEFHDGQAAVTTDKTGNQLEPTAEANPLLTAILQRHTMTQRQLQKLDDSDRNPNSSLLTATGLPLQNVQFDGLTGQTGMWSTGTNDKAQAGIFQEQHQQPQQQQQQQQCQQLQQQKPRPPKKPLTPYMIFSKEIWHQVKAANSHLSSVTEIGAIVGRMWRDLDAEKKEQYNITFNKNKVRYDEEMRVYLKKNNLRPSDLMKSKLPKRHSSLSSHSGLTKSHETTKQLALSKSHDVLSSSDRSFPGNSVQQLIGQMSFSRETVFPSGIAVSENSVVGQTQNQTISAEESDELVHVSAMSPSVSSVNLEKCANSTETTTAAWAWHQPVCLENDTHSKTCTLATENGRVITEASSMSPQAHYYNADGLDQLLHFKEQNMNKLRELAHINDLEMQILQLESALTERTQKADELRQELEAANLLIAHLKEQQQSTCLMETVNADLD